MKPLTCTFYKVGSELIAVNEEIPNHDSLGRYKYWIYDGNKIYLHYANYIHPWKDCNILIASSTKREGLAWIDVEQLVRFDKKSFTERDIRSFAEYTDERNISPKYYNAVFEEWQSHQTISLHAAFDLYTKKEFSEEEIRDGVRNAFIKNIGITADNIIQSLRPSSMPAEYVIENDNLIVTKITF